MFSHSKDELEFHRSPINPLAANVVTEAKRDFAIRHQRAAGKFPAGDILHMEQRQDPLLPPAIRHCFFPKCLPFVWVLFHATQGLPELGTPGLMCQASNNQSIILKSNWNWKKVSVH